MSFNLENNKYSALILINGKKLADTSYKSLDEIDKSDIEIINVLKDSTAIEKYGVLGKNGVIEIKLKTK